MIFWNFTTHVQELNFAKSDTNFNNTKCLIDLESDREVMKDKFDKLAGALLQQDDQIKNLLNIFERFGDYKLNKVTKKFVKTL